MRLPLSRLAAEFEQANSVRVRMTYAGSNMLLGQISLNRKGDVYIAGDADYIRMASERGFVRSRRDLCTIDAAVVWRSIALKYPLDGAMIRIDPEKNICPEVAGAVLTTAENPGTAEAFLTFLVSGRAREVLAENGYTVGRLAQHTACRAER